MASEVDCRFQYRFKSERDWYAVNDVGSYGQARRKIMERRGFNPDESTLLLHFENDGRPLSDDQPIARNRRVIVERRPTDFETITDVELLEDKIEARKRISREDDFHRINALFYKACNTLTGKIHDRTKLQERRSGPQEMADSLMEDLAKADTPDDMIACVGTLRMARATYPYHLHVFGYEGNELDALLNVAMGIHRTPPAERQTFALATQTRKRLFKETARHLIDLEFAVSGQRRRSEIIPPETNDEKTILSTMETVRNRLLVVRNVTDIHHCYRMVLGLQMATRDNRKLSYYFSNPIEALKNILWGIDIL